MGKTTLAVRLLRHTPGPEEVVATGAKLCYSPSRLADLEARISASDQKKFLGHLVEMGHESPLEHAVFTFGVEGISRACSHQLVRHRVASYSQQSQRYVGEKREGESFDFVVPPAVTAAGREAWFCGKMLALQQWYNELVTALGDRGESSNEDARFLLPNAAETKIIVTMNARELRHFFAQRCCGRAQWEIRALAWEMLRLAAQAAPILFAGSGPACLHEACPEGRHSCGQSAAMKTRSREITGLPAGKG